MVMYVNRGVWKVFRPSAHPSFSLFKRVMRAPLLSRVAASIVTCCFCFCYVHPMRSAVRGRDALFRHRDV